MSLLFADSFDHYEQDGSSHLLNGKWEGANVVNCPGRRGTRGARLTSSTSLRKILPNQTSLVIGCAVFIDAGGSMRTEDLAGLGGFRIGNDVATYLDLGIGLAGQIRLRCGEYPWTADDEVLNSIGQPAGRTLWTSNNGVFQFHQWNWLELKVDISGTGAFAVRLNGLQLVDESDVRTIPEGNGFTNPGYATWVELKEGQDVDDVYVLNTDGDTNNDFLGDLQVDLLKPVGPGLHSESSIVGTTPAATRWQSQLTADSGVSAVQFDATDEKYSYAFEDLPYEDATVYGVQLTTQARKSDGGPARVTLTNDVGGETVDAEHDGVALLQVSAGDIYAMQHAALDESADGPWTLERVQDSEFGIRRETVA
jgi:hypothetical protein